MQDYYEGRTDVPVGDLPRQADVVLLRRTAPAPFVGIWRYLTLWSVLEFKGPTDDPGLRDLDLLFEVGLGIDRRLNEERQQQGEPTLARGDVSWWYLANHVGSRFRAEAERLLGNAPQPLGEGVWQCQAFGHVLVLVSRDQVAIDRESVPLHLVTQEPVERELLVAQEVVRQPGFWDVYGSWLAYLYPSLWEEVQQMVRTTGLEPTLDMRPLIEKVGMEQVIDQMGRKRVLEVMGPDQVLAEMGPDWLLSRSALEQILAEKGLDWLLSRLTPELLQQLKQRLS